MRFVQLLFLSLVSLLPSLAVASDDVLTLVDGTSRHQVSVDSLRQEADLEFSIFEPFRGRSVKIRGILLEQVLRKHLSLIPNKIKLIAYDDYDLVFTDWKANHWVIVTHEDDKPLSLRNQGPLRLVERQYQGRDPKNLRDFNDWIWMLKTIEALP